MKAKKNKLFSTLRKTYERFLKIRGHPREISLGFALGIFLGISPSMGLQTAIVVFFAAILKWNKISAAVGVWVTNPVTAPFIYGVNYAIGAKLLGVKKAYGFTDELSITTISKMLQKAPEVLWALTLGGVVLGLPLAVAGFYLSYSVIRRYQEDIKIKLTKKKDELASKRKRMSQKWRRKQVLYPSAKPVKEKNLQKTSEIGRKKLGHRVSNPDG